MKFLRLSAFFLSLVSLCLISCEENDDPAELSPADKEVQEVIDELEKIPEISDFTEELKKVSIPDVETNQLTVFAVKNQELKVRSEVSENQLNQENIKRHIARGAYSIDELKDSLLLTSVSNEPLLVTNQNSIVAINGIPIETAGMKIGNSYMYIGPEVIPVNESIDSIPSTTDKEAIISVKRCNTNWSVMDSVQGRPIEGAEVTVYTADGKTLGVYYTDANGEVSVKHNEPEISYTAISGDSLSNIYDGFMVEGIFTSQVEIDAWPSYIISTPKPGDLKFADVNGDGIIDNSDKVNGIPQRYIRYADGETLKSSVVYLTSNRITPSTDWAQMLQSQKDEWNKQLKSFLNLTRETDAKLIGYIEVPNMFNSNYFNQWGENIWNSGYSLINSYLQANDKFTNSNDCPENVKSEWATASLRMQAECALIYSELSKFFGEVSVINDITGQMPPRNNDALVDYMNYLINMLPSEYSTAVSALVSRIYLSDREYDRALDQCKKIISTGNYSLPADSSLVFSQKNGNNVILGGYDDSDFKYAKGLYYHPVRYCEIMFTAAEAALETGRTMEAYEYINQTRLFRGYPPIENGLTQDELRRVLWNTWNNEMLLESATYFNLRRWGIYVASMPDAQNKHQLLPIPTDAMKENPNLTQNPGY